MTLFFYKHVSRKDKSGWGSLTRLSRQVRQDSLRDLLNQDPFLSDGELASQLAVSVQTIRLDRLKLGIPELRERVKAVASSKMDSMRALSPSEVFGEIVDIEVGESGISVWRGEAQHAFLRSSVIRGHYLFAQANSLAVAIVDADRALTAKATVRFLRSAKTGIALVAKARVVGQRHGYVRVDVQIKAEGEAILSASFLIMRAPNQTLGGGDGENRD